MNAPKHTPGPWHISNSGYANAPNAILGDTREPNWKSRHPYIACKLIAEVFTDESPDRPEKEANARLIAAAPALLAALHRVVAELDGEPGDSLEKVFSSNACAQIRAAMAQAEGRS